MSSKELSAEEYYEQVAKENLGYTKDDYEYKDLIAFATDFATARLEAYKAELAEWLKTVEFPVRYDLPHMAVLTSEIVSKLKEMMNDGNQN